MKIKPYVFFLILISITCMQMACANQNKKMALRTVHFDYDKSYIRTDMIPVMDGNASYIKNKIGTAVTIAGHCDSRGSNEYNYALGARRSEITKSYLVSHGINAARVKTISYGEDKPECNQSNESCWYMNRRAEFFTGTKH